MNPSSLPNPDDITQAVLDNGLRLFVRENHSSPSVVVSGFVPGGSVHELASQAGLSSFTASLLMYGTHERSFEQINDSIEAVGASLSIYSGRHAVGVNGKSLVEDFDMLLGVLGDVLQHPTFPSEYVELVRGQKLTSLQERDNDTRLVASMLFRKLAYPADHPYSWPVEGFVDTVGPLSRNEVLAHYERTYGPSGGALVVVGAVDASHVITRAEQIFGGWPAQPPLPERFPEVTGPAAMMREDKALPGKTQSDIVLGVPGMRRNHPDYEAAALANTILGRFGMMGRLGETVREQLGLAYYAYSQLTASKEPGSWIVSAGVNPANVDRCLAAVDDELAKLGGELAPEDELNDSKSYLVGSLPLQLETNEGVAEAILDMVWYDLGLDYLQRYAGIVKSITAEQVRDVTARYLRPNAYALAVAGPA